MALPDRFGRPGRIARRAALAAVALLGPLAMAWTPDALAQANLPAGFTETVVALGIDSPTALAVVPNGHANAGDIYVASQGGTLFVVPDDGATPVEAFEFANVCTGSEQGLLGVALDPAFTQNNRVFVYVTEERGDDCANRVYRFVANADGTLDPSSRTRLLSTAKLGQSNHNGGDIKFGADGFLYVSIGENARPELAQARNTLFGKIVRIATDGDAPSANPFAGGKKSARCATKGRTKSSKRCAEIFALGLRNPFRIAFEDDGNRFFINDVGQNAWEEIDLGARRANYGWPEREGPCPQGDDRPNCPGANRYTDPVFSYNRDEGCVTITGGAFVPADQGWGGFSGNYLFGDFGCDSIFALSDPFGSDPQSSTFATNVGGVVALQFDPTNPGDLLYTTFGNGGEVRRITP